MVSCGGGSSIQFPSESFMCLLSDAKERRNIGACTTLNNLISKETISYTSVLGVGIQVFIIKENKMIENHYDITS